MKLWPTKSRIAVQVTYLQMFEPVESAPDLARHPVIRAVTNTVFLPIPVRRSRASLAVVRAAQTLR